MNQAVSLLSEKGNHGAEEAAGMITNNPNLLPPVFEAVLSTKKGLKNASIKTLQIISASNPKLLYDQFDFFVTLLNSQDNILLWNATQIIGNLSSIDKENKIEPILEKLLSQLKSPTMITAGNTIGSLQTIAYNQPHHEPTITKALLQTDTVKREEECKSILAGKTILALEHYFDHCSNRKGAISFAEQHLNSRRNATAKKAKAFLKKHEHVDA